jgi:hypothetical protein
MAGVAIYERGDLMHGLPREWLTGSGLFGSGFEHRLCSDRDRAGPRTCQYLDAETRERCPDTRCTASVSQHAIIALSSQARAGLSSAGAAAHVLGVERPVAKPLSRQELLAAVDAVIGPPT